MNKPKVLYIQYTNPGGYPPLEHSSRIIAEGDWEVLFLGTDSFGASSLGFPPHPHITIKRLPFCPPGWQQKLHYFWFCAWVLLWHLRWRPQWVYASDVLSCPIAFLLSLLPGTKLIYHEHDSPGQSAPTAFLKFCIATRQWLAHRVDLCVLPNEQRVKQFVQIVGIEHNTRCVWNCPAREEATFERSPKHDQALRLLYHGSIVPPQLPQTIVQAMALLPNSIELRIMGYETIGHVGYVQFLKDLAIQLGIAERVKYLGTVPTRAELLQNGRTCDVGLTIFPLQSLQPMVGASNKPFDYLACGLPLLVSHCPDWKKMYVELGYGLACNPEDPDNIAEALRWYLEHPVELREMGDRGRQRILSEWNYETQFKPVYQMMRNGDRSNQSESVT